MNREDGTWEDFILEADDVIERAESLEGRGRDFGESVAEKLRDMRKNVEVWEKVTEKQWVALVNMREGVSRWER